MTRAAALVAGAALALAPAAAAHAVFTPNLARPGETVTLRVAVLNETGVPLTGLRIVPPRGAAVVEAAPARGWRVGRGASWTGGWLAPRLTERFTLRVRMPRLPGSHDFRVREEYTGLAPAGYPVSVLVAGEAVGAERGAAPLAAVAAAAAATVAAAAGVLIWARRRRR